MTDVRNVHDICSFCVHEGALRPAVARIAVDMQVLAQPVSTKTLRLLDAAPTYSCAGHVAHLERVIRVALSDAFRRLEEANLTD